MSERKFKMYDRVMFEGKECIFVVYKERNNAIIENGIGWSRSNCEYIPAEYIESKGGFWFVDLNKLTLIEEVIPEVKKIIPEVSGYKVGDAISSPVNLYGFVKGMSYFITKITEGEEGRYLHCDDLCMPEDVLGEIGFKVGDLVLDDENKLRRIVAIIKDAQKPYITRLDKVKINFKTKPFKNLKSANRVEITKSDIAKLLNTTEELLLIKD